MNVLLVSANSERVNMVPMPLGLSLVAAATRRAGHSVALLDLMGEARPRDALERAIASACPEVIGISVRNIDDQRREGPRFLLDQAREVVEACRARSRAPIVLGGAGYSIFPREVLAELRADYGIAGDGEAAFPELLEKLAVGESPLGAAGVHAPGQEPAVVRAACEDLDRFPLWDEDLSPAAALDDLWFPVQSRRGCPRDCSYCSTALIEGRAVRFRSPRRVADAVAAQAARGTTRFYFVDNTFNVPERYALELCRELAATRVPLRWRCILYPERVSRELVDAMAASGCVEVALGFESGCERVLREMNKAFRPDDVRHASELLRARGIQRSGFLLLGGPGETRESVEESLAFADSLRLDALQITVGIRIYPGTALARRAVAEGVIGSEAELLRPRFYLAPGLEPWIHARVAGR